VDDAGRARITDFGLATTAENPDSTRSAPENQIHNARWTAPEILNEEGTFSKEADVFSFAMVMIEVRYGRFQIIVEPRLTVILNYHRGLPVRFRSRIAYHQQQCLR